ncbi:PLP-dependent transferase [Bacillus licheniformis]|nr:PLP-dependent transferase [Bacillus licheniformis]
MTDDVYGGTYRVMTKVLNRIGIEATFSDTSSIEDIEKRSSRIQKRFMLRRRQSFIEITDIKKLLKQRKARLIADCRQHLLHAVLSNPISLGADIVLHSATKYLGGHSDVVGGLVVAASKELAEEIHFIQTLQAGFSGLRIPGS